MNGSRWWLSSSPLVTVQEEDSGAFSVSLASWPVALSPAEGGDGHVQAVSAAPRSRPQTPPNSLAPGRGRGRSVGRRQRPV